MHKQTGDHLGPHADRHEGDGPILVHNEAGVKWVTLFRPKKYNSFTEPMALELQRVLGEAAEEEAVRCVVIQAAGKAFCAGQDLGEVTERQKDPSYSIAETVRTSYNPLVLAIRSLPKPVVCSVQGLAAGAGANLAFCCDLVFASKEAVFLQAFRNIGLIPDSGGTWFLPRLIGRARANALYLLDERVSAEEAERMGLITRAVEGAELQEIVREVAVKLAALPTRAFALYKKAAGLASSNGLEAQLELEAVLQAEAGSTADYREGVAAFLEKRKAVFQGR